MHLPTEIWNNICSYLDIDTRLALRKVFGNDIAIGPNFLIQKANTIIELESKLKLRMPRTYSISNHYVLDLAHGSYQLHKKLCSERDQIMYRLIKVSGESFGENLYTLYNSIGSIYVMAEERRIYRFFYSEGNKDICMCLHMKLGI